MESEEDYFYDDSEDDDYMSLEEDATDVPVVIASSHRSHQKNYVVLKEEDVRRRQKDDIQSVSSVLSISEAEAIVLLRHFHWSVGKVHDEWFADYDEERVGRWRRSVGLLERQTPISPSSDDEVTCRICFESYLGGERMASVSCGHLFCETCWRDYISIAINDGPGCLMLRCPEPSCPAAVGRDMVEWLASQEDKDRYHRYLLRSYVEENRAMKWCPAPGCECAIEFSSASTSESYDVSCLCSHSFCWNCTEENHRPVDCGTVARWIAKNSAESDTTEWMLAHSKPCPKCKRPIEKNRGCMHMTCTAPCRHEFCWLCLGNWSEHGEATGGPRACNRYEAAKKEGLYDEIERNREMAKISIERYSHYYERWLNNQLSRQKALADLRWTQTEHLQTLSEKHSMCKTELEFITEAWLQIVECRRVLKWTYAYGYYLPEHERAKVQFFEYLQGEAEAGLERLHQFLDYDDDKDHVPMDFVDFRIKLISLTKVTKNYFENLVRALENGLADVDSHAAACNEPTSWEPAGGCSSNTRGGGEKGEANSTSGLDSVDS